MYTARRQLAATAAIFVLGISGCSDSDPLDSVSGATHVSATNVSSAGSNGSATDGGNTEGDSEGGTDTAGTAGEPTTGESSMHEVCEHYLDCLAVVSPAELPTAQAGFGPDGSCWNGPIETIEQCLYACESGWEALHNGHPDEPACYLCVSDDDCAAGLACVDGDCRSPNCGDGTLDDDEVCDGQFGCKLDCTAEGCNPLSSAGCGEGEQCFVDQSSTLCLAPGGDLPGAHEPCEPEAPGTCAAGLLCVSAFDVPDCDPEVFEYCCEHLCNVQDGPEACPGGLTCYGIGLEPPQGEYVGVCLFF
ncbi:hypothetical protein SAMN02745121_02385 [Nannocystis exedens]|uniref:Uncharacterized protein n=1 Tax=Nannocystis exedens TaxID=54 RepID=A0A1I1WI32_9BACT|nr:hypothetical protein [Nannocystis exedens]PCC67749.1 hypothetical protein NAEX_00757 [Nannocystis exedens]SFD94864.1 hypothetical protein SAMN02745121_02385 [Nannocystis exedens]